MAIDLTFGAAATAQGVLLAAIFAALNRAERRPEVRDWTFGMGAAAAGKAVLLLGVALASGGAARPLPFVPSLALELAGRIGVALGLAWIFLGVLGMASLHDLQDRTRRRVLGGAAALAALFVVATALAGAPARPRLAAILWSIAFGAVSLVLAAVVVRSEAWRLTRRPRLVVVAFGLSGLLSLCTAGLAIGSVDVGLQGVGGGEIPALALVLEAFVGVGLLAWLHQMEHDRAIAAMEAVRKRERQLRDSEKVEAMGRLAAGIAHDFNNVLTTVSGYSSSLLQQVKGDVELEQDVRQIQRAADRAVGLTRQLLLFSRPRSRPRERVDLNECARRLRDMLARIFDEGVTIDLALAPEPAAAQADALLVEQALLHLAMLAHQEMAGGGTISVRTECDAPGGPRRGRAALVFADDQGTWDVAADPDGSRVATVAGMVTDAGGVLERTMTEGGRHGLVLAFSAGNGGRGLAALPAGVPFGASVLVVEDDEAIRGIIARQLRFLGLDVLDAPDAIEGIRIVRERGDAIGLVVSDLLMPGMDGRTFARRLDEGGLRPPFLFVTGSQGVTDDDWCQDHPADRFLYKPFRPQELAESVSDMLGWAPRAP